MRVKFLFVLFVIMALAGCEGCSDSIVISNTSSNTIGVMVDGQRPSTTRVEDSTITTSQPDTIIGVGKLESSSLGNNVIGFNKFRPVRYEQPNWTSKGNVVDLDFQDEIEIGITVWIVWDPLPSWFGLTLTQFEALDACIFAQQIFDDERCGIKIVDFDINNVTSMNNADDFYDFPTTADITDWENSVGFDSDRINIYYVNTVSGSTTTGRAVNFGQSIILGNAFPPEPVMHEIGHTMSLRHTGSLTNFDDTGIMNNTYDPSDPALFLTEGQTFRMHTEATSSINTVYNARPGEPTTNCIGNVSNSTCIDQDKRIFADGAFPAN